MEAAVIDANHHKEEAARAKADRAAAEEEAARAKRAAAELEGRAAQAPAPGRGLFGEALKSRAGDEVQHRSLVLARAYQADRVCLLFTRSACPD